MSIMPEPIYLPPLRARSQAERDIIEKVLATCTAHAEKLRKELREANGAIQSLMFQSALTAVLTLSADLKNL